MSIFKWDGGQKATGADATAVHKAVAGEVNAMTDKATLADADVFMGENSANSYSKIKATWVNIKATLKTYFDTLYSLTGHTHTGVYAPAAQGVTNGNSHDHVGGDGAQISHTNLSNIGTNTHAQIDTFIASGGGSSFLVNQVFS